MGQPVMWLLLMLLGAIEAANKVWSCPTLNELNGLTCQCDLPHTLRCTGVALQPKALESIVSQLKGAQVSLLDLSIQNMTHVRDFVFDGVTLHGLVISSGVLRDVSENSFRGLGSTLIALGLPNNKLVAIPYSAFRALPLLERLDLSNNRIANVPSHLFTGLSYLQFLDLSDNPLRSLSAEAFVTLPKLQTLVLKNNQLDMGQLTSPATWRGLHQLQHLDLSHNLIKGSLTPEFLQGLDALETLDLSFNNITTLKDKMLSSLSTLGSLTLSYNQIEVIEDHAFMGLSSLTSLVLSHNRVVTVSSQSLAHLHRLTTLDMSHNFLRAVTTDLLSAFSRLTHLDLTDNDISIIQPGVFQSLPQLEQLILTENPLNCDCQLTDFALWLSDPQTRLRSEDRKAVLCAAPPSLENGIVADLNVSSLTCGNDEDPFRAPDDPFMLASQPTEEEMKLSTAHVHLNHFQYNGTHLSTQWDVDEFAEPFKCDAVFIYQMIGEHEVLLESVPVHCDSQTGNMTLNLTVPFNAFRDEQKYRVCLVLLEDHGDEVALLPGCSSPIIIHGKDLAFRIETTTMKHHDHKEENAAQITAFYANVSSAQSISVFMRVSDAPRDCEFTVVIFHQEQLVAHHLVNCSAYSYTFANMGDITYDEEYKVCATFSNHDTMFLPPPDGTREADGDIVFAHHESGRTRYSHCVVAKLPMRPWSLESTLITVVVAVIFLFAGAAALSAVYCFARRIFFRRHKPTSLCIDPIFFPKSASQRALQDPDLEDGPREPTQFFKTEATSDV